MKRHTIEVDGLLEFVAEQKILFARSSRENKSLYVTCNGTYIVEHEGKEVYKGIQPISATLAYNDI